MSSCVRCGSQEGEDGRYARVLTESEIIKKNGRRVREIRETLVDIAHVAVCPRCARRKKWKEVLLTIPITLALTAGMTFMGLFAVRPNRNIRQEVASMPTVLPLVAAVLWLLGLSVYLPRPAALYAAEIVRKETGGPPNVFLLPLNKACYTRKSRPLTAVDIMHRTAAKTGLADELIPLISGEADEESVQALIGKTFTKEEPAR